MSKHGMLVLALLATVLLTPGSPRAAALPEPPDPLGTRTLENVTVAADPQGRPVVTLAADGRLEYESQVLERPYRVVLDLPGAVNQLRAHQYPVNQGGLTRVRASQYKSEPEPVSRVVFDLDEPLPFHVEREGWNLVVRFGETEPSAAAQAPVASNDPPASATAPAEGPLVAANLGAPAGEEVAGVVRVEEHVPAAPAVEPVPQAAPPAPVVTAPAAVEPEAPAPQARSVQPAAVEAALQSAPAVATSGVGQASHADAPVQDAGTPVPEAKPATPASFETKTIAGESAHYTGKRISLNLVDADIKQVFRLFHEISGLNFVLDPSVEGRVTIVLDSVPWDQALDIILKNNGLDKSIENNVIRIASTQKLATEAASRKQLKEAKELEVEPVTITRTLSYAKSKDVERVIREGGVLSARGKVIVDDRTNTLIISDIPKKIEPLDQLISTLDSETPQVMIEARIVETSREFVQDFGVQWGLSAIADASHGTATNLTFPHNASMKYGLNLPGGGGASNLAFKFGNVLDSFTLDIALNALENEGRGRILSSPKIATQNNERAEIEQGLRIPVVNTTATEINVEFVSASLKLGVTPQITAEGTVILDVQVENNSPDFTNTAGGMPSIRTQRAQTKILIGDGGTTVIGGIFVVNEGTSETGVPWFRKIPGLGWLFKQRSITAENRELLIFLTPKIMKLG